MNTRLQTGSARWGESISIGYDLASESELHLKTYLEILLWYLVKPEAYTDNMNHPMHGFLQYVGPPIEVPVLRA